MPDLFASPAMVTGYARARPAVHPEVVDRAWARLGRTGPVGRALDLGCGAGLSTLPLAEIARCCIGIDPVEGMVRGAASVAGRARFAAARAESLPVRSGSIDLVTAAGSLNYVDLEPTFAEVARVLRADGALVVYDFSVGRRFPDSSALDDWFAELLHRYPRPGGAATPLDPEVLARVATGFEVANAEQLEVTLPFTTDTYVEYVMTETNVSHAIANGEGVDAVRSWCGGALGAVFDGEARDVVFDAYLAVLVRQ